MVLQQLSIQEAAAILRDAVQRNALDNTMLATDLFYRSVGQSLETMQGYTQGELRVALGPKSWAILNKEKPVENDAENFDGKLKEDRDILLEKISNAISEQIEKDQKQIKLAREVETPAPNKMIREKLLLDRETLIGFNDGENRIFPQHGKQPDGSVYTVVNGKDTRIGEISKLIENHTERWSNYHDAEIIENLRKNPEIDRLLARMDKLVTVKQEKTAQRSTRT